MRRTHSVKPCGTTAAHRRHLIRGEQPCEPCRTAKRADDTARRRRNGQGPRQLKPCGTNAGHERHRLRGEEPCEPCRTAKRILDYGITPERYAAMLEDQDGRCAICREQGKRRRLSVDHDHQCCPGRKSCGQCVRALLCDRCNHLIGRFHDNPELIDAAAEYVS